MTLDNALYILAAMHTRDDIRSGFAVESGIFTFRFAQFSHAEYIEAWRIVRVHLGLPVDPAPDKV